MCTAEEPFPDIPPSPYASNLPLDESDFKGASTFTENDRLVMTYFFYWYNVDTGEHIFHHDGRDYLTDHPATTEDFTYTSPAWHRKELEDMLAAGIDIALPVYWGCPFCQDWSTVGLEKLVEACDEMTAEGIEPPKIGLFYDTSTLQYNSPHRQIDLTDQYGRDWLYATVRDFFAIVPPKYWAMIDGKPLILLYAAAFAADYDQKAFDEMEARFREDFAGREPYLVRNPAWNVEADNVCAWGAANGGCRAFGFTAIGPGYDHSAVVPPREPLIKDREGGAYYEQSWRNGMASPSNVVVIETWNELHEGTDICETKEYGRQYIDLTAKYAKMFHDRVRPPKPEGAHSACTNVSVTLGAANVGNGLRQVESADGITIATEAGGKYCRKTVRPERGNGYIYFQVDDTFAWAEGGDLAAEIEFYDGAEGELWIEYDGADAKGPMGGAYTPSEHIPLTGAGKWRTEKLNLPNAWMTNRQNAEADLRIAHTLPELFVRRLVVRRK